MFQGENLIDLINAGRPAGYRIGTLGESILKDVKPSAYDIAKSGGDYSKFYERYRNEYLPRLQRAERSYRKVVEEHEGYIRDPMSKLKPGLSPEEIRRYVEKKWPDDITRNTAYLEIITGIIAERTT